MIPGSRLCGCACQRCHGVQLAHPWRWESFGWRRNIAGWATERARWRSQSISCSLQKQHVSLWVQPANLVLDWIAYILLIAAASCSDNRSLGARFYKGMGFRKFIGDWRIDPFQFAEGGGSRRRWNNVEMNCHLCRIPTWMFCFPRDYAFRSNKVRHLTVVLNRF
jgi:hypothetical protein